ncbi:hypothetical protein, partial [Haemophilus parainfluenzae]|uniref:hypothetical protein n=1 Tax=Haemophilus parainfluenzae TaxID=729 RepID=UPI001CEDEC1C
MLVAIIGLNILMALLGFYLAWRIWSLAATLGRVADALMVWEQQTQQVLAPAAIPAGILLGRQQASQFRLRYAR